MRVSLQLKCRSMIKTRRKQGRRGKRVVALYGVFYSLRVLRYCCRSLCSQGKVVRQSSHEKYCCHARVRACPRSVLRRMLGSCSCEYDPAVNMKKYLCQCKQQPTINNENMYLGYDKLLQGRLVRLRTRRTVKRRRIVMPSAFRTARPGTFPAALAQYLRDQRYG